MPLWVCSLGVFVRACGSLAFLVGRAPFSGFSVFLYLVWAPYTWLACALTFSQLWLAGGTFLVGLGVCGCVGRDEVLLVTQIRCLAAIDLGMLFGAVVCRRHARDVLSIRSALPTCVATYCT